MLFIEKLEELKREYGQDCVKRKNGTSLYGTDESMPLYARHKFFLPLSDATIKEYLIDQYRYEIPIEYINFLKYSNGANLFNVKLKTKGFTICHSMFVIYGLPRTQPFGRARDLEEPYDIRIEDLSRHPGISPVWLKCGSYTLETNFENTSDIFVDSTDGCVYSCQRKDDKIIQQWENLESCFCDLFDNFIQLKYEYCL